MRSSTDSNVLEQEEEQSIFHAVQNCRKRGLKVAGPFPADTLFFRAGRGDFDLIVATYHDLGHGPIKVLGLEDIKHYPSASSHM